MLIIDTERKGKANKGVALIEQSLRKAGARSTLVVHSWQLNRQLLDKHNPGALVLTGQGTPWWEYDQKEVAREAAVLRQADLPMLGICGGHQLLGIAFGGKVAPIHKEGNGKGYEGCTRERGWLTVNIKRGDPLLGGNAKKRVWLNHCEEVKSLPANFVRIATDDRSSNQAMRHKSKLIYGVQFHPEVVNSSNGFGKNVLQNFLAIAGVDKKVKKTAE